MTLLNKVLLIVLGLTIVGAIGFIIYQQHQMSVMQTQINTSMVAQKALLDGITRSSSQYVTKQDLDNFAQQNNINLAAIQKDVDSLNAAVGGINQVVVTSQGQNQSGLASTSTKPVVSPAGQTSSTATVTCNGQQIPCPNVDTFGYQKNQQTLALNEQFVVAGPPDSIVPPGTVPSTPQMVSPVPIGSVSFDASNAKPWSVDITPRSYDVTNVLATDQNGKQYVYNQFAITTNGKSYKVPVSTAKFVQQYPTPSFSFWNPRLFLAADAGVGVSHLPPRGEVAAGGRLGIMSYGTTKVTPDWSFLQVGAGYGAVSKTLQIEVSPLQYNIGKHLPFMSNTYIGPTLSVGTDGNISVLGGISVGL